MEKRWLCERWWNSMKTLPTAGVAVGHLLIFHNVARSISILFLLPFLVFDGTTVGALLFFFSSFLFTRQRNCDTVLIRSFPVTQCEVQCAGANSGTKWRHLVFGSQLFSSIPFLVFHCKLVNVTCSCFSCPLGVTGPHILDLYRVPCQVGAVPQGTSRGRSSVFFFF